MTLSNQYYPKTLKNFVEDYEGDEVSENDALSIIYQICRCLEDLKHQNLLKSHGNLKLSNVFMDLEDNVLAIGDFYIKHVTNKVNNDDELYRTMINHLPPEFFTFSHDRDEFSDVWALGIILYQMSTGGDYPFNVETDDGDFDEYETKRALLNIQYDQLEDREKSQKLLDKIFTLKPHDRITIPEIIKSLHGNIDMKKIKTAMKRASENIYESGDESEGDIKKKLDFIIDGSASDDGIMGRQTVSPGLAGKNASFRKVSENFKVTDSRDEEDYNHLDNLVSGHVSGDKTGGKNFMDNLPDSIADSSRVESSSMNDKTSKFSKSSSFEESKDEFSSFESAGQLSKAKKNVVKCIKDKADREIKTNMMSLIKIVVLNKDKLLLFSDAQNYFMSLKNESLQTNDIFAPLSPTESVLYFPPCPGVFNNNMLVVYKEGKVILVDLLQSAERQKLHMTSLKVKFTGMESQSMMDSVTERSDAGDRKFMIPLSGSEFAVVHDQTAKLFTITDFSLKMVKEYSELIPDAVSYFCYYHSSNGRDLTHLAIGTASSSQVVLFNIKNNVIDKTLDCDQDDVTNVFEIDKKYILATTLDGNLIAWDKNTYIQIMKDHIMDQIFVVLKIPNSSLFAVGGEGPLMIYDTLDRAAEIKIKGVSGGIVDIAYNESQNLLICGDQEATLFTYNIEKLLNN